MQSERLITHFHLPSKHLDPKTARVLSFGEEFGTVPKNNLAGELPYDEAYMKDKLSYPLASLGNPE